MHHGVCNMRSPECALKACNKAVLTCGCCVGCVAGRQTAQDQKRAKLWGTLAKKIIQAAKSGGADVAANQRLAEVIKAARAAEVPRDIIDRNIKKATEKGQADYAEVRLRSPYPKPC